MTRHRRFSNWRVMVLAGTLALLCNLKAPAKNSEIAAL